MAEVIKEETQIGTVQSPKVQPATPPAQPGPRSPRNRTNIILAIIACLASLALLALAIVWYVVGPSPALSTASQTATAVANRGPQEVNPTPAPNGFAIQANPGPTATAIPAGNEPARLHALADDFLTQGRPVEAAAQYRLILDKYAKSPEAKPALYGLGQASYQRELYAEAADSFKKYLAAYPQDSLRANCYYYLGQADMQQGYWDEAAAYFQKYQAEQPSKMPLDGYATAELAQIYNNTLKPDQAIEAYKRLADSAVTIQMRVDALEKVGDSYAKSNPTEAIKWYSRVLDLAKLPEYRASITVKLAHAYSDAQQPDKAADLTRQLVYTYVDTSAGFATLRTLYNLNSPLLDDYWRGYYALRAADYDAAITAFDRFLGRPDDKAAQPPTPAGLNADAQGRLARGWYYLANVYESKGDLPRAQAEYQALIGQFATTQAAADAQMKLARLAQNAGNSDEAIRLYGLMVDRYPNDSQAAQAAFNRFELALPKGPATALPYADALAQKYPGAATVSQVYYELGRAYQTANDANGARAAFQKASKSTTVNFYTVRALERLNDAYDPNKPPRSNPATQPAAYSPAQFADDLAKDRPALEKWLSGWATQVYTATSSLDAARTVLNSDGSLQRIAALRTVSAFDEADQEAKEVFDRYSDRPLELYLLSLSLSEQGEYYYSLSAANRLLVLYQRPNPAAGVRDVPLLLQKLMYPLPFQSIVLEQSRRQDFDPLLLMATIKQESAFNPQAHSGAGAMGLSQIMPDTGRGIAGNLDTPGFKLDDLYKPYTAIEFGAYYLAARLRDFDGNPYQALAAYNGGAGNVYRWNKANPPDQNFDKWLFGIDYQETRNYVQIIYANYYMYRQVYSNQAQNH